MLFLSKAKTLSALEGKLQSCTVLPQLCYKTEKFLSDRQGILDEIASNFDIVIVRSSAAVEDGNGSSFAGAFLSIANVNAKNSAECGSAIERVLDSYKNQNPNDEFFVQPMLTGVSASGVMFTADADSLASYVTINIDFSGETDGVTSGASNDFKTFVYFKNHNAGYMDELHKTLLDAAHELENIFDNNALDIEFAFVGKSLYLLQVRPLVREGKLDLSPLDMRDALEKVSKKIAKISKPHPSLLGSKAIYGVMPDWNPAEIIGIKPKKLALTIYKELVTDSVWAYQRDNYGYRNLRSHPLLVDFLGVPFIDVRVSFNSFVPKTLDEKIAEKLVEYYLDELIKAPHFHDKVEFEIVFSCYTLDLSSRLQKLKSHGFNDNELKRIEFALLNLTNAVIKGDGGFYKKDIAKIEKLKARHDAVVDSDLSMVDKIYWLTEECKRYGTLPFAGIARAAFMATQFLDSLVAVGILSKEQKHDFLSSLNTVSKSMSNHLSDLFDRKLSRDEFLQMYGHLRPGTYDICSLSYSKAFDKYFGCAPKKPHSTSFEWSAPQIDKINLLLAENGLDIRFDELICFIKESIEAREYSKFVFTKTLSKILDYVEEYGDRLGICAEEMAYLSIGDILGLYSSIAASDVVDIFKEAIARNKREYMFTQAVKLPSLLLDETDIYRFELEDGEPNFVTLKSVCADVAFSDDGAVAGKIVCIKNADPGYDFLFAKGIAGLITCYGGANSHMAVRCSELGIPAVIGVGEAAYGKYAKSKKIEIDASGRVCRVIA